MTIHYCYNPQAKRKASASALATLRKVAAVLGLQKGEYDLRFNPGGIAVWGEATLHTEHWYIQIQPHNDLGILVRTCTGRKDYTGGRNTWIPTGASPERIAEHAMALVKRMVQC